MTASACVVDQGVVDDAVGARLEGAQHPSLQGAVGAREDHLRSHSVRTRLRVCARARQDHLRYHVRTRLRARARAGTHFCLVVIVRLRVRLRRAGHTREVDGTGPRDKLVQPRQHFISAPLGGGASKRAVIGGVQPAGAI